LSPQSQTSIQPATTQQSSLGPNLISNPSFETAGPSGWGKGGYGTNDRTFTYPATPAEDGVAAAKVTVTTYTNGDAKWYFTDVPVTAGSTYQFSDYSIATVPSVITARFTMPGGVYSYKDYAFPAASTSYQNNTFQFIVPSGATSVTFFHLINSVGSLTIDNVSLNSVTNTPPPPPPSGSIVPNGNFETAGSNGLPQGWIKGGYGTNARAYSYPVTGASGNGAQVSITAYTSGDAKWAFTPVLVTAGAQYTYSDSYMSNISSILTAQFTRSDGTLSYLDLATLPPASSFTTASKSFVIPPGVTAVTIFHLINTVGSLTIDNVTIMPGNSPAGIFTTTGAVTFRFDDGIDDQYSVAAPILDNAGFKAVFYIISQQILDNDFSGYMSIANVQDLAKRGYEIGAHTRTHPHLTTLTAAEQQDEIAGSRQDILGWNVGLVNSFAYPYGEYDSTTLQIVKDTGFTNAASTITGYVTPTSDPYQLEYQECHNNVSLATLESYVNSAAANHRWLIMLFHGIQSDTSSDFYSCTPTMLQSIVNYVKQKGIPVITPDQGRAAMP
jgi:peptidoglycan/xylan/chitin deacetylase (PgdA/CDA1 family)